MAERISPDVVDIATSQLGVTETGTNDGEPFRRYSLPGEQPLAWCARFCRWCFSHAGHRLPGNPYEIASVATLQAALERAGAWLGWDDYVPARGDLIFLGKNGISDTGRPGRHVGIVENAARPHVYSIEGNWGDAVRRVARRLDDPVIWGYARWPLGASA